jgi:hypothetical protein
MSRLPAITERSGRYLIAILLCIKLLLLVWNAKVYDGRTYQPEHHSDRALFAGLKPGKLSYDPPLYYLPARLLSRPADVPLVERSSAEASDGPDVVRPKRATKQERAFRAELLNLLRYSNVLWIGLFYVAWIGYAFPRLLRGRHSWFLASLLLLAIPGYQKLAAMSHPDNSLAATSAVAVCCWLWLRERWLEASANTSPASDAGKYTRHLLLFALAIGLVGLTRPLAVAYVASLTLVALVYAARFSAKRWNLLLPRAATVVLLVGLLSASWYVVRWHETGAVLASVRDEVTAQYQPLRAGFPFWRYFHTFYPGELWDAPNFVLGREKDARAGNSSVAGSFPSLLHSEIWGDHWLSFSGPNQKETKAWPKNLSMAVAYLTPLITPLLFAAWLWTLGGRVVELWRASAARGLERLRGLCATFEAELVLGSICLIGAALFLCWQTGPALMPGDNSSVKFIYVAAFFPAAIALPFTRPLERLPSLLLAGYFLCLYLAAFPVAMFYPS